MDKKEFLKSIETFKHFSGQSIEKIAGLAEEISQKSGEKIFSEGDDGAHLFIVAEGDVTISKKTSPDSEKVLAVLGPSTVFGETSLRLDQPRGATPDFSSNKIEFSGGSNWAGVSHPYAQDEVLTATIDGIDEPVRGGFSAGLNSFHDDGVVVAFGDGSVRLLSRKMDSKRESPRLLTNR